MRRFLIFALLAFAAWYGWTHGRELFTRRPRHSAVIENQGDAAIRRLRVRVDGQTLVAEEIAAGASATLPFQVQRDSEFELEWEAAVGARSWSGGLVPAGPMIQRHHFTIDDEGHVLYRAERP